MKKTEKLISELYSYVEEMHNSAALYATVDTGIYTAFHDIVDVEDFEHLILFKDTYIEEYELVAPYLVRLERESEWTKVLLLEGYASRWVTFVVSGQEILTLANEIRERINIYSELYEKEIIFRFYDPRNVSRYFKMLTKSEQSEFFRDIDGLIAYIDVEENNMLKLYTQEGLKSLSLSGEEGSE